MAPTSGGGFALMTEGLSLSAITETPIVIALSQRPGPATGLPTRTEQGDLNFVIHAGHGEFPRAVFAPGSINECFHLTRKAFQLAERYQAPAFVLTDQFQADSYRAVEPFDIAGLKKITYADTAKVDPADYKRYATAADGVSPRLLPGKSKALVRVDSDEHNEEGLIEESPSNRIRMNDKRLKKWEGMSKEAIPPQIGGDENPDMFIVGWGSTKGAIAEAAGKLSEGGKKTGTMHFSQVWPIVGNHFVETLSKAKQVVCVEGNATGQFAGIIKRETGFNIEKRVLRYDGMPHTPQSILDQLE